MQVEKQNITTVNRSLRTLHQNNDQDFVDRRPLTIAQAKMAEIIQMSSRPAKKQDRRSAMPDGRAGTHYRGRSTGPGSIQEHFNHIVSKDALEHIMYGNSRTEEIEPKGLHCYIGGKLPAGVVKIDQVGSATGIHEIWWRTGSTTNELVKWSTMFPSNWTEDEIVGAITTTVENRTLGRETMYKGMALIIKHNGTGVGETYYPELPGGGNGRDTVRTVDGTTYRVTNPMP